MSLFARLLKKPCATPAHPAVPDFMIPESQNQIAALPAVAAPEVPAREIVCSREKMIPESRNGAIRKSMIPESQNFTLHRKPADYPPEERALRDQKLEFIRAVWELHVSSGCPEGRACALVAEKRAEDFPLLMMAGKNGTSAMRYNNYRNWVNGTGKGANRKPGLGRLNDGSPDYRNADVLLRNYALAGTKELYGDPMFWGALRGLWLRNSNPYLSKTYRHLRWIWETDYPDQILPSLAQVRERFKKDFPLRMQLLARKGANFYDQNIRDYIERDADSIRPGEAWVADTKDCDFLIRVPAPDGYAKSDWVPVRPKLVVIMDVKSQFPVSVQLIAGNCNNAVIRNGFAAAVHRFGRPRIFLTDNGSDYCKAGFGDPVVFTPTVDSSKIYQHSILRELDVEHNKALPYNARAKIVERFFREVAGYERDSRAYVGNKPENRPATADVWAKIKGRKYLDSVDEACKWIAELIMIYLNTPSHGKFLNGLTPIQAFRPEIRYTRAPLSEEEYIRAFRLPLQESKKLDMRGPSVRLNNARYVVIPEDRERSWKYDNQLVMIKTIQFDDSRIYIYGLDGTYIAECRIAEKLDYFDAPKELLAERQKEIRSESVTLNARLMDLTGGWHLIDGEITYQQPREAFAAPAPVKLLDTMHSVKGETHNAKIHILGSEELPEDRKPSKTVCSRKKMIPESSENTDVPTADPEMDALVERALTGTFEQVSGEAFRIPEITENSEQETFKIPTIEEKNNDNSYELPDVL